MFRIFPSFLMLICSTSLLAQITVTNTQTPAQLVQNILLGNGVVASNFTYNGSAAAADTLQANVSFFNSNGSAFPISNGLLLTSGNSSVAIGPNNSPSAGNPAGTGFINDSDFDSIGTFQSPTNGARIEFDFIPLGNVIQFQYIFGSEEYPEYLGFGDAFGFFLSGPGISGPYSLGAVNLAVLPNGTTPVSVPTVNNGVGNSGPCQNCAFYSHNVNGLAWGTSIQYDGTTVVLTATANVTCGVTYHIKLGVCNKGDQNWDSGVFIKAGSFSSNGVTVSVVGGSGIGGDTTLTEGCQSATIWLDRPLTDVAETITYTVSGTATSGADYTPLSGTIFFPVGEDSASLNITALIDGIAEVGEYIVISTSYVNLCGNTIVNADTLYIRDAIVQLISSPYNTPCFSSSFPVQVIPIGGTAPYTYNWTNYPGVTTATNSVAVSLPGNNFYAVTVTDVCGLTATDTVLVVNAAASQNNGTITPVNANPTCFGNIAISGIANPAGGFSGPFSYSWSNGATGNSTTIPIFANGVTTYTLTAVGGCNYIASQLVSITMNQVPLIGVINTTNRILNCPINNYQLTSSNANNLNAPYTYSWTPGGQTTQNINVNVQNEGVTTYTVTSVGTCGYTATSTMTVTLDTLEIDQVSILEATACQPNGAVIGTGLNILPAPNPSPIYTWSGPGPNNPSSISASVWENLPPGWYYFSISQNGCTVNDSIELTTANPPNAVPVVNPTSGIAPLTVTFGNNSTNANNYFWNLGNGVTSTSTVPGNQIYTDFGTYNGYLVATINGGCPDTAFFTIIVDTVIPIIPPIFLPLTYQIPNILTPNNDNVNDIWFIKSENAENIDLIITNRWGNQILISNAKTATWDGKIDGEVAADGTYFYQAIIYGFQGEKRIEQGFIHLTNK